MKRIIAAIFLILGCTFLWWKNSSQESASLAVLSENLTQSPEEILSDDYSKIARNLKQENIGGDEWKQVNDYSLAPSSLVTKKNAASFFKAAQNNIPDIYSCLKKDFCGMTTRNDDDAYFDDKKTPAHILINRNLQIMKESLRKDESLRTQVDWDLIQELARSDAEILQVEALDILREFDSESMKTDELIKLTEDYKGTAKADALVRLSKRTGSSDKTLVSSEIEEVFAGSDNNTAISVLENLKQMALPAAEKKRVLKNLCSFKESGETDPNWKMIVFLAKQINSEFEKNCN